MKMMIIDNEDKVYEYEETCNANTYILCRNLEVGEEIPHAMNINSV